MHSPLLHNGILMDLIKCFCNPFKTRQTLTLGNKICSYLNECCSQCLCRRQIYPLQLQIKTVHSQTKQKQTNKQQQTNKQGYIQEYNTHNVNNSETLEKSDKIIGWTVVSGDAGLKSFLCLKRRNTTVTYQFAMHRSTINRALFKK